METYLVANGRELPASFFGKSKDYDWDGRATKRIHTKMSHDEAVEFFTDGLNWSIKTVVPPTKEGEEPKIAIYDNSEYKLSGSILDNRDGTIDILMGKLTTLEQFIEDIYGGVNYVG